MTPPNPAMNEYPFGCRVALAFLALTSLAGGPSRADNEAELPTEGTRKMAGRLEQLAAAVRPMQVPYLNTERAAVLGRLLQEKTTPQRALQLLPRYGTELLNSGQNEAALQVFDGLRELAAQQSPDFARENARLLLLFRALCYLRIGEQANCVGMHNPDSCLLPIRGGGIHRHPEGSRSAREVLTAMVKANRDDLEARWLLNIACMTLGEYPDGVPADALIPPRAFESEYDIHRFVNVAPKVGLDLAELSGGSIVDDFDGDGLLDVVTSSIGYHDPLRSFRNNGDGTFAEREHDAGLDGENGGLNLVQADYDNDGALDILVLRGAWFGAGGHLPNSLLRNRGDGTFDDVTEAAGLLSFHPTQTAAWFDYDNDGWLDLFIGNESGGSERHPCELFHSRGNGTFEEIANEAGVDLRAFVKGVTAGDFDQDGRTDLYVSVLEGPNHLFRNLGPGAHPGGHTAGWRFQDVTESAGVAEPHYSFATWFFDYDNDGWPDLFVTGYQATDAAPVAADFLGLPPRSEVPRLYHNNGDGTFTDLARQAGLARITYPMGANYGDLDNDGFLDFYLGTGAPDLAILVPNRMFRNDAGRRFQDVTTSGGFGHLQKGHGISFADIDNDGDEDIHEDMGGAYSGDTAHNVLFENPGHGNHWVTLKLEGRTSARDAHGARIEVTVVEDGRDRRIFRTVGSGGSFGASPLRQEIGLGHATGLKSIRVQWPATGRTQEVTGVTFDGFYKVREGETAARPWKLPLFRLGGFPAAVSASPPAAKQAARQAASDGAPVTSRPHP